jgi:hypothetical protein
VEVTFDLFEQLEDLYGVKSRHVKYLGGILGSSWQATIPGGYSSIWEQRGWKFYLKDFRPYPKPLGLLNPDKRQLLVWTMIGFTNELLMEVSPESLGNFLELYVDNPGARRNLVELFMGEDMKGPGFKAFGSLVVCAKEENRFLDRYLPMLQAFAGGDLKKSGVDAEYRDLAIGFFRELEDFTRYLESDIMLFKHLNRDLKELFTGKVSVGVLGVGEISSVLGLTSNTPEKHGPVTSLAYKKMPPFPDTESVESYRRLFDRYHRVLKETGLNPPRHGIRQMFRDDGMVTVFVTQSRLPEECIGSNVIRSVGTDDCVRLFRMVLEEAYKVALRNQTEPDLLLGIDIQISNWGVEGFDPKDPEVSGSERLLYIDTSTPMLRENGEDLLDAELFLKTVPSFIRPIVRWLFLQDVLDRYYDFREIVKDLIANFIKEGRPDVLERLVEQANLFFAEKEGVIDLEPLTVREVNKYYRHDRLIWIVFQAGRRIDRFFQTMVLRKKYPYRLPEKIGLFSSRDSKADGNRERPSRV